MRVRIDVRNKDLDLVEIKEYDFQEYFDYLSRKTASILYLIEAYTSDLAEYETLRNTVLDLAGHLKRLPNNLTFLDKEE